MKNLADKLREHKDIPIDTAPHLIVEARAGTGKTTTLIEGLKLLRDQRTELTPSPQQQAIWQSMCQSKRLVEEKYIFTGSACFVAFNIAIADELRQRMPKGCDAMTMHSMGFRALRNKFLTFEVLHLSQYRVRDIVLELQANDLREQRQLGSLGVVLPKSLEEQSDLLQATERLVSLCKMNLTDGGACWSQEKAKEHADQSLAELASHYDVELNGNEQEVFDLVPRVLERCKDVARDGCVDFDDMIWLPIVLGLDVYRYDLLLVDEAQDLNRCQQQLALKAGHRLILVGDPKQAIYGWAGADGKSMARMQRILSNTGKDYTICNHCKGTKTYSGLGDLGDAVDGDRDCRFCEGKGMVTTPGTLRGCITLPLTVTRRCGRAIVKEAKKIVPDFEAHEDNCDGRISNMPFVSDDSRCTRADGYHDWDPHNICKVCGKVVHYMSAVSDCGGDMILCRVNAPLVSECFKFIRQGRKATIRGRKIGQGLVFTIRKMKAGSIDHLKGQLTRWFATEKQKEILRPHPSENRLINLQDRYDCLLYFIDGSTSVQNVINRIQTIFSDDNQGRNKGDTGAPGILLSSIHKAKGLESDRVFLLMPKGAGIPHPMARTPQQREEEMNCLYVAITRAREELCYVT